MERVIVVVCVVGFAFVAYVYGFVRGRRREVVGAADIAGVRGLVAELAVAQQKERSTFSDELAKFSWKLDRVTEERRLVLVWGTAALEGRPVTIAAEPQWCREGEELQFQLNSQVAVENLVVHVESPFVLRRVFVGTNVQLWIGAAREVTCERIAPGIAVTCHVQWPGRSER